jgi:hypothetical protein
MRDEPISLNIVGALRVIVYCYLSPSEADCYTHPLFSSLLFATLFSSHKSRSVPPDTPFCSFPFFPSLSSPLLSSHSFNFPFLSPLTSPYLTIPSFIPFPFPSSPLVSCAYLQGVSLSACIRALLFYSIRCNSIRLDANLFG